MMLGREEVLVCLLTRLFQFVAVEQGFRTTHSVPTFAVPRTKPVRLVQRSLPGILL